MSTDSSLYFFNDQYNGKIIDRSIHDLKNKLYYRALEAQSSQANISSIYGTMSDFKVDSEINNKYKFSAGTVSFKLNTNIIPYYNKKKFLNKYEYNTPLSLVDIINDYTTFSRRIIFNIDKYMFMMLKVIPIKDGTILVIHDDNTNGISTSTLTSFINTNSEWSLVLENQSDFYYSYKVKTTLFSSGKDSISMNQILSKLEFNKINKKGVCNIAISSSTTDLNLLSQSTAVLANDTDGVTKCFMVSPAYKAYIMANTNNCKCYIFDNYELHGFGTISNLSSDPRIMMRIVYNKNPIPVKNINIWTYDPINDTKLIRKRNSLTQEYPNLYELSSLTRGLNYYFDWYSANIDPIEFDNSIGDYIECYSSSYIDMILNQTAPQALLDYHPISNFEYDYDDYITKNVDNIREYKLIKLKELMKDNGDRYKDFIKKINVNNRKYIYASYDMSIDTIIYNRSVFDNSDKITNLEDRITFSEPHIYIILSNLSGLNRDAILFIDGLRVAPTVICTENYKTYIYIPHSALTSNSKIIIEVPLIGANGTSKYTGDFSLYATDVGEKFPSAEAFGDICSRDLIFYDKESLNYYDTSLFNMSILVKTSTLKNDNEEIDVRYSSMNDKIYFLTDDSEFLLTTTQQKIEITDDTTLIKGPSTFGKRIPADNILISSDSISMLNKSLSVSNTDNFRLFNIPNIEVSNIGSFSNFKEDPSYNRFRVYINGLLVNGNHYNYTPPLNYGGDVTFEITSYTPIVPPVITMNRNLSIVDYNYKIQFLLYDGRTFFILTDYIPYVSTYVDGEALYIKGSVYRLVDGLWNIFGNYNYSPFTNIDNIKYIETNVNIPTGLNGTVPFYIQSPSTIINTTNSAIIDYVPYKEKTLIDSQLTPNKPWWINKSINISTDIKHLIYGNGKFIAIPSESTNKYYVSLDGKHWTDHILPINTSWSTAYFANGKFILAAVPDSTTNICISEDGFNWNVHVIQNSYEFKSISYSNGNFVAITNNKILYSSNAIDWTVDTALNTTITNWVSVVYGNGTFVIIGSAKIVQITIRSNGGRTLITIDIPFINQTNKLSMAYGNGKFVIVGYDNSKFTESYNGLNWTQHSLPTNIDIQSIIYGRDCFAAISRDGSYSMISKDGVSWNVHSLSNQRNYNSIAYGNNLFVTIGYYNDGNPSIATLSDGRPILYNTNFFNLSLLTENPFDKNTARIYLDGRRISNDKIIETLYMNVIKINGFMSSNVIRIDVPEADEDCYDYNVNKLGILSNELLSVDTTFRTFIDNKY